MVDSLAKMCYNRFTKRKGDSTMKKVIIVLFVLVVVSMLLAGYVFDKPTADLRSCQVMSCGNGIVTVKDANGDLWAFYSDVQFPLGCMIVCVFDGDAIVNIL
jgi:hypothetical protein